MRLEGHEPGESVHPRWLSRLNGGFDDLDLKFGRDFVTRHITEFKR